MIDNPNPRNFYSEKEMVDRQNYIPTLKENLLKHLEDLTNKIKNEEPFPEDVNLDVDVLVEFDDAIENILNYWYY